MRERHPIDDLFKRVLDDAGSAPPIDVWHSIQRRRGWLHRARVRADRHRPIAALLLLLVLGGGVATRALFRPAAEDEPNSVEYGMGRAALNAPDAVERAAHSTGPVQGAGKIAPTGPKEMSIDTAIHAFRGIPPPSGSQPDRPRQERRSSASTGHNAPPQTSIRHEPAHQLGEATSPRSAGRTREFEGEVTRPAGNNTPPEQRTRPGANRAMDPLFVRTSLGDQDERFAMKDGLEPMKSRPIELACEPNNSSVRGGGETWAYVLERGAYWLGTRWSVQGLDGGWRGPQPLSEELDGAETWRTQYAATLCFGRRWRSGVSVATGLEYAQRTSRFLFDEGGVSEASVVIDTVWSGTPSGTATIYTWEIDSAVVMEPGGYQHYSSTDRYSFIRVPLELGWRTEIRRWSVGGRLGAALSIPVNRDGSTLAYTTSAQDGTIGTVDLQNEAVSGRFGAMLSLTMAVEAGHQLSEHWSIHAGPTLARDLVETGSTPRPDLWAFGAFFGVEFELPSRERIRNARTTTP